MKKPILLSGLQPTGKLHIGNYLGALKNHVILQNSEDYECYFFIADYHALTEPRSVKEQKKFIQELMLDNRAAGLDDKKSVLLVQSHIPEHAELAWILSTVTPMGELERMTQYKDKTARGLSANAGLFNYPILMAADILLYKSQVIPVGDDQDQHIEFTRAVARNFNKRFGKTFPEPKVVHTRVPRVMSLTNPERKMSKSDPKGCLFLSDSSVVIKQKIQSAVTDSNSTISYDLKKRPGVSNLISIYAEFADMDKESVSRQFKDVGYGAFKQALSRLLLEKLEPLHKKRRELSKDREKIQKTYEIGSNRARKIARTTMEEVKKKIGLF
jgi:tryptophanyl-tRNA synthetase